MKALSKKVMAFKSFDFSSFKKKALETITLAWEVRNLSEAEVKKDMSAEEVSLVEDYYKAFYINLSEFDKTNFFNFVKFQKLQTQQPEELFFDFLSFNEKQLAQEFHPADLCFEQTKQMEEF